MAEMKHPENPIHILLGGGIGSGKSIVGQELKEFGLMVIEADHIGHAVLEPVGEAFRSVSHRWPWVAVDGRINRGALADIVFADREQLDELEALTHPEIIHRIGEIAGSTDDLVVEMPLILDVPGEWTRIFVDANENVRLRRAVARGSSEEDVRLRMANQPSHDEWLAWCDVTIDNNSSIEDLERQIDSLWYGLRTTDNGLRP